MSFHLLPSYLELQYLAFLGPDIFQMCLFEIVVSVSETLSDCFALLSVQLMRVEIALKWSTDNRM